MILICEAWNIHGESYPVTMMWNLSQHLPFILTYGHLARYVKLQVAQAPGMPGTFSPPPRVSDPNMHHGTCVTHVPWWMLGSLTGDFLWSRWWRKRSRHSRRMSSWQFYVYGKRPMEHYLLGYQKSNWYQWVRCIVLYCKYNAWRIKWQEPIWPDHVGIVSYPL